MPPHLPGHIAHASAAVSEMVWRPRAGPGRRRHDPKLNPGHAVDPVFANVEQPDHGRGIHIVARIEQVGA